MGEPKNRRRGDELLESLFASAFKLINEQGHTNLSFKQLAAAAGTSRTVLYRRWPTILNLLQDVYIHKAKKLFDGSFFDELQDTGSLRNDLIELLSLYQRIQLEIGIDIINNYYHIRLQDKEHDKRPAAHDLAREKHLQAVRRILDRAEARGEPIRNISQLTLMLPYDLIRIENLVRPGNLDNDRIENLVDEVLLPAFVSKE
ncbi:TetR/AcrR family transcriptional regulator [Mucilaginibacter corticis]|uniref:TetR/AcrR family transcriptional regulator n=2 Tax=Mucilaginibacter corticis TaxID=2597670 RepID=A0A556MXN2_9SPHI|nr:TetR/AcrR family transcriptional regulator [Mucilaginibacter corticis]